MSSFEIAQAFNKGSINYDQEAIVQKIIAEKLARKLQDYAVPNSILEIGCGTGFLTDLIHYKFPSSIYHATDIAFSMLHFCKEKSPQSKKLNFFVMNGEQIAFQHRPNWIISSLSFQWFKDFEKSLKNLWENTNMLAFTTLVQGSFQEWDQFCHQQNIENKFINFINEVTLKEICLRLNPSSFHYEIETEKTIF